MITPRGALRESAVLHVLSGAGAAVVIPWVLVAMAREQQIQTGPLGIRALAGGPFERLDIEAMVRLGWVYVGLSLVEVLAGILLWQHRRAGAWLSMGATPPLVVFWVGFALPLTRCWPPFVFGCCGRSGGQLR